MNKIIINNYDGQLTVSSVQVAKDFKKEHQHVTQAIENLTSENSLVKNLFIESSYINERGREYKCYELTRDGFSLLVMGFTGKKALEWKLKYIEAFNLMEQKLIHQSVNLEEVIVKAVTLAVSETIKAIRPILQESPVQEVSDDMYNDFKPRCHRVSHSIISRLKPELRIAVDDMLLSERYTYEEVRKFLAEQGVAVSSSSIQRHKAFLYRI